MSEEQAFREAMRRDPNDNITRLVYADWLDDHDRPEPAQKIRAWVEARKHLEPTSGDMETGHTNAHLAQLPEPFRILLQSHMVNRVSDHPGVRDAAHAAELHAYGLDTPDEWQQARDRAGLLRAGHGLSPAHVYAARGVTHPLVVSLHSHVPNDAAQASRNPGSEERLQNIMAQKLVKHFRENPVKLSRIGDLVKGAISRVFGSKPPVRQPGDGIVHTASDPTAVYAEHNAVLQAIRLLGGTAAATPERARQYMNWIHAFNKAKPDHALVKAYTDAAKQWHTGGTAGPALTEAVKPLVGAVNLLMSAHGKDERFVKPTSEAAPTHVPPEPVHSAPAMPAYEVVEDPPVDLSDTPEPTEDRHTAIMRMTREGKPKEEIVKHLMDAHGAPHRKAALASIRSAYNRAIVLHQRAKQGPTKLAAYKPGDPITPDHLTGSVSSRDPVTGAAFSFHSPVEGTSLAFHLRQIAKDHPDLQSLTEAALSGRPHRSGRINVGDKSSDDPYHHIGVALRARRSPYANAHDWSEIAEQHRRDAAVEHAVNKIVTGHGLSELKRWDMIARADRSKNGEQFYARLEKALGGKHGDREAIKESIRRIQERALDRAYLQAVREEGTRLNPDWRQTMGGGR